LRPNAIQSQGHGLRVAKGIGQQFRSAPQHHFGDFERLFGVAFFHPLRETLGKVRLLDDPRLRSRLSEEGVRTAAAWPRSAMIQRFAESVTKAIG
jgi:hypothetical protein